MVTAGEATCLVKKLFVCTWALQVTNYWDTKISGEPGGTLVAARVPGICWP